MYGSGDLSRMRTASLATSATSARVPSARPRINAPFNAEAGQPRHFTPIANRNRVRIPSRTVMADQLTQSRSKSWIGPRGLEIMRSSAWSLIAKAVGAASLFLAIPFVLDALGPEQFGAWATLTSLVTFAGFLDFGLGNGTMNLVASAFGRGELDQVGAVFREGRRTLIQIALTVGVLALIAIPFVPWHELLGLRPELAAASRSSAAVVLFTIVLAIPLNLATRVQLGVGRGDRAFRWQAIGQLLALGAVILLARTRAPLPVLTAAAISVPLIASLGNTLSLLRDPTFAPAHREHRRDIAARIRKEGLLFFVLQLCAAVAFSFDLPLISSLRGSVDAGHYAIVQRIFSVIPISLALFWTPLWPGYRNALASGHHEWAARTFRRSLVMGTALAAGCGLVLAVAFDPLTTWWLGARPPIHWLLLVGFAVWCVLDAVATATATFLNAAGVMRPQVIVAIAFAGLSLPLKMWCASNLELHSVIWVTVCLSFFVNLLPFWLLRHRLLGAVRTKAY